MIAMALRRAVRRDGRIVYELEPLFRYVFGAIGVFLLIGIIGRGDGGLGALVIIAIIVLGGLYDERWTIEPATGTLTARSGLLIVGRRRRWRLDAIEAVEYAHHRAGSIPGSRQTSPRSEATETTPRGFLPRRRAVHYLWYAIRTTDGTTARVEIRRVRDWNREIALVEAFAADVGVALEERTD